MILFILSIILICISSYLIASMFYHKNASEKKAQISGFVYFLLTAFAQIVLSFELLSIFSFISKIGFLFLNIVVFLLSLFCWNKVDRPLYCPNISNEVSKIKKALKLDISLKILGFAFLFFIVVSLLLCIFVPVNSYDGLAYHLGRVPFWLSNGNLSHFDISDARALVMPINSELLYMWVLIFLKEDWALGLFSFLGYALSVLVLYNFLGDLKFCTRKKLWTVFILSSIASVLVEASSTETDIIIGGLCFASIYLFFRAVKEEGSKISIFFSSLAYALAIGTKTPAIMAFPACMLLFSGISYMYKKQDFLKPVFIFLGFLTVNFILFASYNYVLNFINYQNPMGMDSVIVLHSFFGGFKAFVANFVRHIFMMFDFSGFNYGDYLGPIIRAFQNDIFDALRLPYDAGVLIPLDNEVNKSSLDPVMGPGLLGFLLFLPCIVYSIFAVIKKQFSAKKSILALLGVMFFLNIMVLSFSVGFMIYSVRFLTFFIILSSMVLVYSYTKNNRNIFKWFIIFFSLSYLVVISSHLGSRPFFKLGYMYKQEKTITNLRERIRCSETFMYDNSMSVCLLKRELEKKPKKKNVALFTGIDFRVYPIKMLEQKGWNIDFLLLEDFEKYDLSKYDIIVTNNIFQYGSFPKYYEQRKNEYTIKNNEILFSKDHKSNCFYADKDSSIIFNDRKITPAYSFCYIPTKYLAEKNYRLIKKISVEEDTPEKLKSIFIYEKR